MARVLLTGARGFVGGPCLDLLVRQGHEVHAVSSQPVSRSGSSATWHQVDLLHAAETRGLLEAIRPELLLHLAWITEHGRYWTAEENHDWVAGSLALAESFVAVGGRRMLTAGTCAEYDWTRPGPYAESEPGGPPATIYGRCKQQLRQGLEALADRSRLSQAWGRIFSPYGPGEAPQRFIPSVIGSLLRGEPARMSSGRQLRDFLHVSDVAAALVSLLESPVTGPVNIGSGVGVPMVDVARRLAERLKAPHLLQVGALPDRPGEPDQLVADVGRLRDEVGFTASCSLDDGLAGTADWWLANLPVRDADKHPSSPP